ncbi:hypothetical protein SNE35_17560 [Paucibacter sp. R3-3]|uniref:Permease n=1 Tax=Roseateles agri TaxID=3098619 RepID=A0ABU5DJ53_9BURK|nr:hypothetical protein [Paucibacter sp. R3-3]MDY0746323.1 hypothetical protein [Paucibacter sp. R3-3]
MVAAHPVLNLLIPVMGGIFLGSLFGGGRSVRRLHVAEAAKLLLHLLVVLVGFYLFAGLSVADWCCCAIGYLIAQFEMHRLAPSP